MDRSKWHGHTNRAVAVDDNASNTRPTTAAQKSLEHTNCGRHTVATGLLMVVMLLMVMDMVLNRSMTHPASTMAVGTVAVRALLIATRVSLPTTLIGMMMHDVSDCHCRLFWLRSWLNYNGLLGLSRLLWQVNIHLDSLSGFGRRKTDRLLRCLHDDRSW